MISLSSGKNEVQNACICILLLLYPVVSQAQVIWQRSPQNLIMQKSLNVSEGLAIGSPSLIDEGDTLKMLYAAGGVDSKGRISYAYSTDGVQWTKYNNAQPVLDVGNPGSWDSHFLDTPDWLKDNSGYKMYYFGDTDNLSVGGAIGLAVSVDGINWTRHGSQPVLSPGAPGDWDGLFIESPSVLYDGSLYYMWYSGIDTTWRVRIGVATSPDGITWTKYPGNPVISEGSLYAWDGFSVAVPAVIYRNQLFEMWYCGVSNLDLLDNNTVDTLKVGYATSPDGLNWTRYSGNPVMNTYDSPYDSIEYRGPWVPDVIYRAQEDRLYMWYETAYGFGLATSGNGLSVSAAEIPGIRIYPNPANDMIRVEPDVMPNGGKMGFTLFDAGGRPVISGDFHPHIPEINVTRLAEGTYFLEIRQGNRVTGTGKMQISR